VDFLFRICGDLIAAQLIIREKPKALRLGSSLGNHFSKNTHIYGS
jgi:hypothetical protein